MFSIALQQPSWVEFAQWLAGSFIAIFAQGQTCTEVLPNSIFVMDKKCFLAVLLIMKKVRNEWERDVIGSWRYKMSYATQWMGIDKYSHRVISLD